MKVFDISTRIELDWIPLKDGLAAYERKVTTNGELESVAQGIARIEDLEKSQGEVNVGFITVGKEKCYVSMYPKKIRKIILDTIINYGDNILLLEEMAIKNPYTLAKENQMEDVELLAINFANYSIVTTEGKVIPRAFFFDYMSGIDNETCDLESLLEVLKNRSDVLPPKREEELTISSIPYYNASEERNEQIRFIWAPSEEDMDKVSEYIFHFNSSSKLKVIYEIFGVTPKQVEEV